MKQSNKEQNSVIFSIAEILGKMSNQVNFLIRHDKLLSQLDVDMLMENTRKLYDTICSVNCNMDVDSIPMEIENCEELELREEEPETKSQEEVFFDFEVKDVVEDESDDEVVEYDDTVEDDIPEDDNENDIEEDDIEEDDEHNLPEDDLEDSGIRSYIKVKTDETSVHTINDTLEQSDDNSLASVLQKKSITDIMAAIDLNDKFLFLNELFNSNMEKYNKSIRALNSFSTLLGAKTYMSELQIEHQWDCESEAYKKLNDLIERRFI